MVHLPMFRRNNGLRVLYGVKQSSVQFDLKTEIAKFSDTKENMSTISQSYHTRMETRLA
jgi:hypothetical protein